MPNPMKIRSRLHKTKTITLLVTFSLENFYVTEHMKRGRSVAFYTLPIMLDCAIRQFRDNPKTMQLLYQLCHSSRYYDQEGTVWMEGAQLAWPFAIGPFVGALASRRYLPHFPRVSKIAGAAAIVGGSAYTACAGMSWVYFVKSGRAQWNIFRMIDATEETIRSPYHTLKWPYWSMCVKHRKLSNIDCLDKYALPNYPKVVKEAHEEVAFVLHDMFSRPLAEHNKKIQIELKDVLDPRVAAFLDEIDTENYVREGTGSIG